MTEIPKRILLLDIVVSQFILLLLILVFKSFFIKVEFSEFLTLKFDGPILMILLLGVFLSFVLEGLFFKFLLKEKLRDEINLLIIKKLSWPELILIFLTGAVVEEILFRGLLQPQIGLLAANIIFTLIHFRYLKKKFLLLETFILGLIMGLVYKYTAQLYAVVLCHFCVNIGTAFLLKKKIITLE